MTDQPQIQPDVLTPAFEALDEFMMLHDVPKTELLIIGGAAMNLGGHVNRATIDVDLLGVAYETEPGGEPDFASAFPPDFRTCIRAVAGEFNLMDHWLNLGPAGLIGSLPDGVLDRANKRTVGERLVLERLVLHIAGRIDLIYLKTHAVANTTGTQRSNVHRQDLQALDPSPGELAQAIQWSRDIYQSISDTWNWDNRYLHETYRELAVEISGKPLPDHFFKSGVESNET